jgi:hypothetical protein
MYSSKLLRLSGSNLWRVQCSNIMMKRLWGSETKGERKKKTRKEGKKERKKGGREGARNESRRQM